MIRYAQENGVQVTAFSSFGAASYHELGVGKEASLLENATVAEMAKTIGKTPGQVALRWAVQRGLAVIPKTCTPSRLLENASVFDWELSEDNMKTLNNLNKNLRFNDPGVFCEEAFGMFYPIYE